VGRGAACRDDTPDDHDGGEEERGPADVGEEEVGGDLHEDVADEEDGDAGLWVELADGDDKSAARAVVDKAEKSWAECRKYIPDILPRSAPAPLSCRPCRRVWRSQYCSCRGTVEHQLYISKSELHSVIILRVCLLKHTVTEQKSEQSPDGTLTSIFSDL
jgi:hypothetical protein